MPDEAIASVTRAANDGKAGEPVGEPSSPADSEASDRVLSVAELGLLAAALVVGLVALVSLATADLHHHTPVTVAVFSLSLLVVVAGLVARLDRPAVRLDLAGLLPVLAGLAFAAVMLFPGFHYATGDRDPGAYVEHAVAISRTHSINFPDDLVQAHLPGSTTVGAEWPALWDQPGHPGMILPQFYHLWPALLATAKDTGGFTGLFNTGPLMGVLAVGLAAAAGRRIAGVPGAWAAAALLSTNMLEVWQAKYPTAEIFGQMLFSAAVLAIVITIRTGWRTAAAAAGVLIGLSYLERADSLLLVLMGWGGLALLYAARRFDQRAGWFGIGLLVLLPYGFYQAYGLAKVYTLDNAVPTLAKVLAAMVGLAVLAALLRWQHRPVARLLAVFDRPRPRFVLGGVFIGICGLLALIGGLRQRLFGVDYGDYLGQPIRTYDEISLIRLSWFFSLPGMFLMFAGLVYVGWRRWQLDRWVIALPTVGLLAVYCYHVKNSPYLMWATRRFVTTVVPGMVLLMACGVALGIWLIGRYLPKLVAIGVMAALVIGLAVFDLSESWPLRSHNENGGSIAVEQKLTALAGNQQGVYLWFRSAYCCNAPYQLFGGPMFAIQGQSSALMPTDEKQLEAALVSYVNHFQASGRPVFYIADKKTVPPTVAGVTATKVTEIKGALPHWEETYISRPKKRNDYGYDFTVYRLVHS